MITIQYLPTAPSGLPWRAEGDLLPEERISSRKLSELLEEIGQTECPPDHLMIEVPRQHLSGMTTDDLECLYTFLRGLREELDYTRLSVDFYAAKLAVARRALEEQQLQNPSADAVINASRDMFGLDDVRSATEAMRPQIMELAGVVGRRMKGIAEEDEV